VDDVVRVGDKVRAKVLRAEEGKIALSLKALEHK
jgi:predicted RNA-binding protein with RPS1 domain